VSCLTPPPPHARLVQEEGSIYAKLYASWLEQTR
jgi:ATP-binding cassette, subfamily B, bacterial